jgi:hypothetical protein
LISSHLHLPREGKRPALARFARPHFPHRHNPDGSFDSICIECFQTVATKVEEAELVSHEAEHVCCGFGLGSTPHLENRKSDAE